MIQSGNPDTNHKLATHKVKNKKKLISGSKPIDRLMNLMECGNGFTLFLKIYCHNQG